MRIVTLVLLGLFISQVTWGDGLVRPPRNYKGSLEERSQEAIIVFQSGSEKKSAVQDLILKISVKGTAENFGWVVPFPSVPKTAEEDAKLFSECFSYVESRIRPRPVKSDNRAFGGAESTPKTALQSVRVISREVVGSYEVAIVEEKIEGALNKWLEKEGYQPIGDTKAAKEVVGYYRKKKYVFACIKVNNVKTKGIADLHPLRFTFETGGQDGIYFPMKLTGLQNEPFDVNLYVFYGAWLNDKLNRHGYMHRGFRLKFRDYDTSRCKPNAGKTWSLPGEDPYLAPYASKIRNLTKYFQKKYPGDRFYLTNIQANNLKPKDVRDWSNDLWLFPYYVDKSFVPFDKRPGGAASD